MTTEQLSKPRYKVIATYPFNDHFMLNEVITLDEFDGREHLAAHMKEHFVIQRPLNPHSDRLPLTMHESTFNLYPHLFRRLEWWQEREISDLPEYVRLKIDIPYYGFKKGQVCPMGEISEKRDSKFNKHYVTLSGKPLIDLNSIEPATLADYNHYCQQVKQKV
jgi:hypothetical protein